MRKCSSDRLSRTGEEEGNQLPLYCGFMGLSVDVTCAKEEEEEGESFQWNG